MKLSLFVSLMSAAALSLSVVGCSGTPEGEESASEVGSVESGLANAPIDTKHKFNVGLCMGDLKADGTCTGYHCSATLVAPNVVLTAQHCIYGIEYAERWCDSRFTNERLSDSPIRVTTSDSSVSGTPKWYDAADVHVPAKSLCGDDIALVTLKTRVPLREAIPVPMAIGRDIDRNPPRSVAIVGRGGLDSTLDLETFDYTDDDGGLKRRILENVPVVCTPGTAAGCDVEDYSSPPTNTFNVPSSLFAIGRSLESGDSGTAIFDQRTFRLVPAVIGVAMATTFDANGKTKVGLVTRIDTHRDFIARTMLQAIFAR